MDEALSDIDKANTSEQVDIIELRIDFITTIDAEKLEILFSQCKKPMIVTCREKKDGGEYVGFEKKELLLAAIELHVNFIDIEHDYEDKQDVIDANHIHGLHSSIIISHHDFEKTPSLEELNDLYSIMRRSEGHIFKLVTTANSIFDTKYAKNFNSIICLSKK